MSELAETACESLYPSSIAAMTETPRRSASSASLLFAIAAEIARLVHFAATGDRSACRTRLPETRIRARG